MEKSRFFWIINKSDRPQVSMVYDKPLGMSVEHSKNSYITPLQLAIYKFLSCSTNIPRGLSAYNPEKLVVYCLITWQGTPGYV